MALLLCAAMGLAACVGSGASSGHATSSPSASGASLLCTYHERPQEADTVSVTVACTVAGAAASEMSFNLAHFVAGPKGNDNNQFRVVGEIGFIFGDNIMKK